MSALEISAVVLNYRTPELTLGCLASLAPAMGQDRRAVVVDNDSRDGSADRIERELAARGWGWAEVLRSPRNGGFAWGMNLGIRHQRAAGYLLLNSDLELEPGALDALWRALRERPRAGLVGPLTLDEARQPRVSAFRDPTPRRELLGAASLGLLSAALGGDEVPLPPGGSARPVDWLSFACVLLRGSCLEEVGLLDPGYFMYFEDAELCRRARAHGWEAVYAPEAVALHLGGRSGPPALRLAEARSRSRYFATFGGRRALWAANLCWSAGRLVSRGRELLGRERRYPPGAWRALWAGARHPLLPWEWSGCSD